MAVPITSTGAVIVDPSAGEVTSTVGALTSLVSMTSSVVEASPVFPCGVGGRSDDVVTSHRAGHERGAAARVERDGLAVDRQADRGHAHVVGGRDDERDERIDIDRGVRADHQVHPRRLAIDQHVQVVRLRDERARGCRRR